MSIGKKIKEMREERKITQEVLAYKVGVTQTAISNIERDVNIPALVTGRAIARALDCKVEDFAGDFYTKRKEMKQNGTYNADSFLYGR